MGIDPQIPPHPLGYTMCEGKIAEQVVTNWQLVTIRSLVKIWKLVTVR